MEIPVTLIVRCTETLAVVTAQLDLLVTHIQHHQAQTIHVMLIALLLTSSVFITQDIALPALATTIHRVQHIPVTHGKQASHLTHVRPLALQRTTL